MIAKHTLSLTPDYVKHWGLWEAVRELLQNAHDQHRDDRHSRVVFERNDECLTVGVTNCHLEPKTLLLGASTKTAQHIGQFGEGYKLAMLTLVRASFDVVVRNGDETWVPRFEWSEEYESDVLTVERTESEGNNGVFFEIRDVDDKSYAEILEKYLPGIADNTILDASHLRGKVFVGGLFVCEVEEFEYGYNFSPSRMKLDRDRGMVSTYDAAIASSMCWEESGDDEATYEAISKGHSDVAYVSPSNPDYLVARYMEDHPDEIPVSSDYEANRLLQTGHKVRKVAPIIRDTIRRMVKFEFRRKGKPSERLEAFRVQFGHLIYNEEMKREFDAIVEESLAWNCAGSVKSQHKEVAL